jgi:hypothetical protein
MLLQSFGLTLSRKELVMAKRKKCPSGILEVSKQLFITSVKMQRACGISYREIERSLGIRMNKGFAAFRAAKNFKWP